MKTKEQIKTISGKILFELEKENNTIKDTLIAGIRSGANLRGANLRRANLRGADLHGADLLGADLHGADLHGANLCRANLYGTDLCWADLHGADLCCADLRYANLGDANLGDANLGDANLRRANLLGADLYGADLRGANLGYANLGYTNLGDANLHGEDLRGAKLRGADLGYANLCDGTKVPFVPFACPSEGAFIGWKKVRDYLIKLEIPEDAKRCSATTNKCRCDKAKVLSITNIKSGEEIQELCNDSYSACIYKVGKMVYPDSFDDDRWNECSNGIHFFINKQEAINY